MPSGAWRELLGACQRLVRANCRTHRERHTAAIRSALERIDGPGDPRDRDFLLRDLALYALEYEEDPEAAELVTRARRHGVLPKRPDGC